MKQAVMVEPGRIELRNVEKPVPGIGQVLVHIKRIGVCGSDLHVYNGNHPYTSYPIVQGHEVSGVVAETGSGVEGFSPGQKVTFAPQVTCGSCYPCTDGMYHICESLKVMGFQMDGAAQEYFAIDAAQTFKVSDSVSLDETAMIEPIAVAVHALTRAQIDIAGKKVVVLGAGTIGNLVAQTAKASGAARVIVTDISEYKLAKALECGIECAINANKEDLHKVIIQQFGIDKADLILECVGAQVAIDSAIDSARKGGTIIVVGVFGKKPEVNLGFVQDRELSLVGSLMYQSKDYKRAIELVAEGSLCLEPMITHRFPFEEYQKAYETIGASGGEYLKVMIELDS